MRVKGVIVFIIALVAVCSVVSALWSISLPVFDGNLITGNVISFPVDTVPMYAALNGISWASCLTTCAARSIIWNVYTTDPSEAINIAASTTCASGMGLGACPGVGDPIFYVIKNADGDDTVPLYQLRIQADAIAGQQVGFQSLRKPITYFYTTNEAERDAAIRNGWTLKGTVGYLYKTQKAGTKPIYRTSQVVPVSPPKDVYNLATSGSGSPLGYGFDKTYESLINPPQGNNPVSTMCTFSYSDWSLCSAAGVQTRTVLSLSPEDCTGSEPSLSQKCTPSCTAADWIVVPVSSDCVVDFNTNSGLKRTYKYQRTNGCQGGVQHNEGMQYHFRCENLPSYSPSGEILEVTRTSAKGRLTYPSSTKTLAYINNGTHTQNIQVEVNRLDGPEHASISSFSFDSAGNFNFALPSWVVPGGSYKIDLNSRIYEPNVMTGTKIDFVFLGSRYFDIGKDGSILPPQEPFPINPATYVAPSNPSTSSSGSAGLSNVTDSTVPLTVNATIVSTPKCAEADWQSVISPVSCPSTGVQTKTWNQIGRCEGGVNYTNQQETVSCTSVVTTQTDPNSNVSTSGPISCESFTYTAWNACADGVQSRSFTAAFPFGCTGGNPLTVQACTSAVGGSCSGTGYDGQCSSGLACISNTCQNPPQPLIDTAPYGSTLSSEGNRLRGWAGDADCLNIGCSVELHFYMDSPAGNTEAFIGSTLADQQFAGTERNNYAFNFPSGYPNDQNHVVYVYALGKDAQGQNNGNNILLGTTTISAVSTGTASISCTDFAYSDWSTCSQSGTQSRAVLTSGPAGCFGGNPVTSQQCQYIPPCTDADWQAALNPIDCPFIGQQSLTWTKVGQCQGGVVKETSTVSCTPQTVRCSGFEYTDWSTCSQSGTQVRSVLGTSPNGCQGGTPITVQSCQYVPICTDTDWQMYLVPASCPESGVQARIWNKIGVCEGGVSHSQDTVSCTPPVAVTYYCTGYETPGSVSCGQDSGLTGDTPKSLTSGSCDGVTKCQYWCGPGKVYRGGECVSAQTTTFQCVGGQTPGSVSCGQDSGLTSDTQNVLTTGQCDGVTKCQYWCGAGKVYDNGACVFPAESSETPNPIITFVLGLLRSSKITGNVVNDLTTTCTDFTYTNWSTCSQSGTQSRAVLTSGPAGCFGGNPVTSQQCQYIPPCTDADWQIEIVPAQCPSSNAGQAIQTVKSKKIGQCAGGAEGIKEVSFVCNPQNQISPNNLNLSSITSFLNNFTGTGVPGNNTFGAACASFTYTNWSVCSQSGTQSRYVTAASPAGCFGGNPVISQTCSNPNLERGNSASNTGSAGYGNSCTDLASCKYTPSKCPKWGKQVRTCYNNCIKTSLTEEVSCTPGTSATSSKNTEAESSGFGKKFVCKIANLFDKEQYKTCLE